MTLPQHGKRLLTKMAMPNWRLSNNLVSFPANIIKIKKGNHTFRRNVFFWVVFKYILPTSLKACMPLHMRTNVVII